MTLSAETNLVDIDLIPEGKGPPYDVFAKWRAADKLHWNPAPEPGSYKIHMKGFSFERGFWVLTKYADVDAVSRDQAQFSSYEGSPVIWDPDEGGLALQRAGLMGMPPEKHLKVKRLIVPPFGPREMQAFTPEIAKVATEIVDDIATLGSCEFVFDVASKLPVYTFCTLMGIPPEDREKIMRLGNRMADVESERQDLEDPRAEIMAYGIGLMQQKRREPDRSLMSTFANTEVDGERLGDDQIAMFFVTMAIAGHETTRGTAAHFVRLMSEHPDQYALLRSDVDKYIDGAISEVLRHAPPVAQFRRTATRDTMIGNTPIAKGDKIYLSYAAANRDPEVFADPDRFDITRSNAGKHLSFGMGPHICLGARLATIQLRLLLKEIVTRIPDIKPVGEPRFLKSIWFNAVIDMPVSFTPEKAA